MRELQAGIAQLRLPHALSAGILAIALGLVLALGLYAIRNQISFVWPALPIPVVAASARRLQRNRQSSSRMWRLNKFYDRAVQRVKGNWAGGGVAGEEFSDPGHVYARDLHVFGEGSLFELLCIARTSIGQRGLAEYLLEAPHLEESRLRQEAVRELRERTDLREKLATLGVAEFLESRQDTFDEWLNSPKLPFARPLPVIAAITSGLLAGIVLAGFDGIVPWISVAIWILPLVAFHTAVGLFFRNRINRLLGSLRPVASETAVLEEGLRLLAEEPFRSDKLRQLAEHVREGARSMRKLQRLLNALAQRDKDWFYGPSRVLLAGTQLCMAIEHWRRKHGEALKVWLRAWAEFEALNALGAYSYENPDNTFPEFSTDETHFEAHALGHPLLAHGSCVVNDIELSRASPFYVISGSNMSGKSTFLRAIGLNAVLAFAGAPVRAHALRLSGLSIVASMSLVDSLLNGKSKFMAEVDRLRQAIESAAQDRPVLFLVDEIFSGTNSRDRRIAAESVVRTLVNRGAIGALSTHDLALTEIASTEGMCGVNVHMGSRDERDPMDFDYRLKPGITQEANALAIARMAGVPV
ncbi:MAG: DNA mismatch repair protein MutS [Bryobacteraceae bacterium]